MQISHGIYSFYLPVAGSTVAEVRERIAADIRMHPSTSAFIDGQLAEETAQLSAGQTLAFIRRAGEMGGGPPRDFEQHEIDRPTTP